MIIHHLPVPPRGTCMSRPWMAVVFVENFVTYSVDDANSPCLLHEMSQLEGGEKHQPEARFSTLLLRRRVFIKHVNLMSY